MINQILTLLIKLFLKLKGENYSFNKISRILVKLTKFLYQENMILLMLK